MSWLVPRNELTVAQSRAVGLSSRRHRLVIGSPGSGKTLVLLHRARHLVDEHRIPDSRYRILVFTNVLKAYIRTALQDLRLPEECVTTFDDWCRRFYRTHIGGRVPWDGKSPDFKAIRRAVWKRVRSQKRLIPLYDFVLVDEGQDLDARAYETLKGIAGHVTVYMDHKQQLYEGADEKGVLTALGLRKRNLTLLDAYRCSPYIVRVAAAFIRDPSEREAFIEQNPPVDKGERQTPLLYLARAFKDERERLIEVVRTRVDRNDRIAILFPTRRHVFGYAKGLGEAGLEVEVPRQPGRKRKNTTPTIDFGTSRPKLMAYPSAKGLTFDTVLMPCLNRRLFRVMDERLERWLFVGITRATKWIYFSTTDGDSTLFLDRFRGLERRRQLTIERFADALPKPRPKIDRVNLSDLF